MKYALGIVNESIFSMNMRSTRSKIEPHEILKSGMNMFFNNYYAAL